MKPISFVAILLFLLLTACKKDKLDSTVTLHRKWQPYSMSILKMDDSFSQGACNYQTKVSDMYGTSALTSCRRDDIYDFTDPKTLTVHSMSKCAPSEMSVSIQPYERRGDSLIINGYPHFIVSMTSDTLILDYCTDYNPTPPGSVILNRAKIGMKFIALK